MRWTGNVGRTVGHVLLALGIIAVVLGVLGLLAGAILLGNAMEDPAVRGSDVGDVLEALVLGGMGLVAAGTVGIVLALVVLGAARAVRDRAARSVPATDAAPTGGPAS